MIWFFYNVLFVFVFLLMLPRFLWRMCKRGGYRKDFMQRVAWYSASTRARLMEKPRIWIHAVSVGEFYVALRFMRSWQVRHPGQSFVVTTTTSTAHALAQKELGADDVLLYFPLDLPTVMRRVCALVQPRMLVLVECELWPNLIRACHAQGVPITLINGRLSKRSYRGYRLLRGFTRRLLPMCNVLCMQTPEDAQRMIRLGAIVSRVTDVGSVKYELGVRNPAEEQRMGRIIQHAGIPADSRILLLGGSTWPGEERTLLEVYQRVRQQYSALRLILVPRHAERAREVVRAIEESGLSHALRSRIAESHSPKKNGPEPDVLLVDSTGELRHLYAHADIIFVGKSLSPNRGGQNMIEPAAYAKPVIVGPHMENFKAVLADFKSAEACVQVRDASGLESALIDLLSNTERRMEIGQRAKALLRAKSGATERTLDALGTVWRGVR